MRPQSSVRGGMFYTVSRASSSLVPMVDLLLFLSITTSSIDLTWSISASGTMKLVLFIHGWWRFHALIIRETLRCIEKKPLGLKCHHHHHQWCSTLMLFIPRSAQAGCYTKRDHQGAPPHAPVRLNISAESGANGIWSIKLEKWINVPNTDQKCPVYCVFPLHTNRHTWVNSRCCSFVLPLSSGLHKSLYLLLKSFSKMSPGKTRWESELMNRRTVTGSLGCGPRSEIINSIMTSKTFHSWSLSISLN